ncbi:hypothetical protein ncot_01115 [Nocardioides sp. JQ2195]|uniref:hypothetical protein n=1 Tax=Nocardioides sp. JQ2195 TaxID=2592334 RepID=UPI00143EDBE4|nr:hypothetical protein [Nocardioides sp. JQ2195]QIX25341.1 hypothetical protein ncot_01115 [Nocardioides sp. JQ2195]
MHRRRSAAIGTFALTLFAPLVVVGGSATAGTAASPDALRTPALPANATAGPSVVTPAMQTEIDRVVKAGQTASARSAMRAGPTSLADSQVRCADFEGQRYCLNTGWTTASQASVRREAAGDLTALAARSRSTETTGDLTVADAMRQRAALSPRKRAAAERAELTEAAESVGKVWLLRHQVQGEPLPDGFLERHPEITVDSTPVAARSTTSDTTTATTKSTKDYPQQDVILNRNRIKEQNRTYWCGVSAMQTIAWNASGTRKSQRYWAARLGTTTSGTAISEMVRVTNAYTGWDKERFAGKYIVLDIGSWSYRQWWKLQMRHITDYHAPVILHPILLRQFYPYLDDDASGHFQVGRGYDKNGSKANKLKYFEPWNQQRFDPSEPFISRTQTRGAYKSYRANQAHSMHNIGV